MDEVLVDEPVPFEVVEVALVAEVTDAVPGLSSSGKYCSVWRARLLELTSTGNNRHFARSSNHLIRKLFSHENHSEID